MAVVKKTDTSFEATFRSLGKATKDYTEQVGDSVEKLKKKVDSYTAAVARGEKVDAVARLKAEKSYRAALAVRRESEQNDLKKLNMFHRLLAFGERKYDRIQKLKWFKTDLKDKRQLVDTKFGKALLKIGNSWEKFQNVKLFRVAADSYRRLKDHAISIFEEILGPAKQVFDIAMTAGKAMFSTLSSFIPILKKVGGIFGSKDQVDEVVQATNVARDKLVEQTMGINEKLERQIAGQEHAAEQEEKKKRTAPKEAGKKGFFSSLLDGFTGFFGNLLGGAGLLGVFEKILGGGNLLGVFMKALGVLTAGVVGWEVGKWINEKYGKQISDAIDKAVEILSPTKKQEKIMEKLQDVHVKTMQNLAKTEVALYKKTQERYQEQRGNIEYAAKEIGVNKETLVKMIGIESRYNPAAKAATSSAAGMGQFLKGTWKQIMEAHPEEVERYGITEEGRTTDPRQQAIMTALLAKDNAAAIRKKTGREATDEELYMAHFAGISGASAMTRAGDSAIGANVLPDAASSNPSIFYDKGRPRTVGEIRRLLSGRLNKFNLAAMEQPQGAAPVVASLEKQRVAAEAGVQARMQEDFFRAIKEGRSPEFTTAPVINLLQQAGVSGTASTAETDIPITFYPAGFVLASSQ